MSHSVPADWLLGQQMDEYRLEALLGQGGMARVYRAFDVYLKRWAAVKVIDAPFQANSDYIKRFEREARAIAQLRHPHIVGLYRYGQVNRLLYMAMEYIEGDDLAVVMASYQQKQEPFPAEDAGRIIRQVCSALDYAHGKGVIHRDIKPANIVLGAAGNATLTDFGLVLLDDRQTRGEVFGTPHYIAPEQAISSAGAVPQSDLYAVGVILYEMFTGQLPFDAAHPYDLAMLHLTEPPPPPREINPDISPALEAVILRALAKEPEDRYSTGAALADALKQVLPATNKGKPASSQPESTLIGCKLEQYVIIEQVSRGKIAGVYRGHHQKLKRDVAVKVFFAYSVDNERELKRFHRQAQAIVTLQHPHIVRVHGFGVYDDLHYMVMEYIAGGTLRDWLIRRKSSGGPVPLVVVRRIIQGVAAALDYAHAQGIVHGDLKPANIMLTATGRFVLTDLGLVHLMRSVARTALGYALRTPAYMSPEQAGGQVGDKYSDIYALGVILYELVTGRVPFKARTPFATLMKHKSEPVPPPRSLNPQLPAAVEQVVLKALAKDPHARYATAGELAEALMQAIGSKG